MEMPKWGLPTFTASCGLLIGFGVGYYCGKKKKSEVISKHVFVEKKLTEPSDGEALEEPKNPVFIEKVIIDAEAFAAQIQAKEQLNKEIQEIREKDQEILSRPTNNVFTEDTNEVWDYEVELANRKSTEPYIIHKDEFIENESEYSQETLTYYSGDDIMADPADSPLFGWFDMLGTLKFGHGSDDPNVVYIRNDVLHYEWEVLRHTGLFEVEVGGLTIEDEYAKQDLKHSNSPRKFREF